MKKIITTLTHSFNILLGLFFLGSSILSFALLAVSGGHPIFLITMLFLISEGIYIFLNGRWKYIYGGILLSVCFAYFLNWNLFPPDPYYHMGATGVLGVDVKESNLAEHRTISMLSSIFGVVLGLVCLFGFLERSVHDEHVI